MRKGMMMNWRFELILHQYLLSDIDDFTGDLAGHSVVVLREVELCLWLSFMLVLRFRGCNCCCSMLEIDHGRRAFFGWLSVIIDSYIWVHQWDAFLLGEENFWWQEPTQQSKKWKVAKSSTTSSSMCIFHHFFRFAVHCNFQLRIANSSLHYRPYDQPPSFSPTPSTKRFKSWLPKISCLNPTLPRPFRNPRTAHKTSPLCVPCRN